MGRHHRPDDAPAMPARDPGGPPRSDGGPRHTDRAARQDASIAEPDRQARIARAHRRLRHTEAAAAWAPVSV